MATDAAVSAAAFKHLGRPVPEPAENWLREQAVKEGWSKALKLQTRPMSQGLVGILSSKSMGVMVEMNCETDFVAKNARFQQLVRSVVSTCWQNVSQQLPSLSSSSDCHKIILSGDDVMQLKMASGQTVKDYIVSEISSVGENMAARRALAVAATKETEFVGQYVHIAGLLAEEPTEEGGVSLGKYAALVTVRRSEGADGAVGPSSEEELQSVATQIGQHVVGMKPAVLDDDVNIANSEQHVRSDSSAPLSREETGTVASQPAAAAESRALLRQEFLMDSSVTVKEWLQEKHVDVVNFARFEVGEDLCDATGDQRAAGSGSP